VRRRDFIKAVFVPAITWPVTALAQRPKKPVIGLLCSTSSDAYASRIASIRHGLNETGFAEGQNLTIEYRWSDGQYDRLPAMAADLVRSRVDVILAITTPAAVAAKDANDDSAHRFRGWRGPHKAWARGKPQPARRQSHGRQLVECRTRSKTVGTSARNRAHDKDIPKLKKPPLMSGINRT